MPMLKQKLIQVMVVIMVTDDMEDMDILMLMEKAMVTMLPNAM